MFIEISGVENLSVYYEIRTILGFKAKQVVLISGINKVNIKDLPSGIYYYTIFVNDTSKASGKQIIIR